jgi:ATP-dependent DNA helicase RecQ
LQEGTPFYSKYQFQPNISSAEMLSHFEGQRQDFLRNVLSTAEKAKIWFTIDLEQAARKAASPRDRVVRALDYLAEQGWLQLKVEGVRNRFHVLKQPADLAALAADLHRRMLKREEREIGRLQQVLGWAGHDGCQVARLCEHFGEKLDRNCGHCSWCTSRGKIDLPPRPATMIDESVWKEAQRLRAQTPDPLRDPRSFARFLCGITSPKLSRQRLSSHALFGAMADVPFATILSRAS